jgi:nucleoside phosphorylase
MIFIVVATKHEAKPLIDIFKLSFCNDTRGFKCYQNNNIKLVISVVGKINCAIASTYLLQNSNKNDLIFNIGICAGKRVGEFCDIGKVIDKESKKEFVLDDTKKTIFIKSYI